MEQIAELVKNGGENMAKIEKFLAKSKKVMVAGEEIDIYPLTTRNIDLFLKLADEKIDVKSKAMKELIDITFSKSFPEASEEERNNVSVEYLNDFVNAILEVNGLSELKPDDNS